MENQRKIVYTNRPMTKEQFFYAYQSLARNVEEHLLLESGRDGKYSIAGVHPLAKLQINQDDQLEVTWRNGEKELLEGDPLESLLQFSNRFHIKATEALPFFQGGVLGFISYDYARRIEKLPNLTKELFKTPDLYFYLFDEWAVLDIDNEEAYFMALPEKGDAIEEVADKWLKASAQVPYRDVSAVEPDLSAVDVSVSGPQFEEMVRSVQAYIEQGDVTQVNLSVRQSKQLKVTPLELYEALRLVNPSPYMASIGAQDFSVASSSPELLVKKRGDVIETRPIGGTRRRGATTEEDEFNAQDLLNDEKEKAEHKILVDLEKEDFARVCLPHTVETNEFMVVEKYSHVMHLVSNVRGIVGENVSNADIVKAVFPGGTITGAPKVRTMEIIEELEPERRGLYTGSIGWFGFDGDFELNVVIRTAFIQNDTVHIQAGAGLVKESVPAAEYVESLAKGEALWKAKAVAEQFVGEKERK